MENEDESDIIWLVHWTHYDKSGGDFVKAFASKDEAEELLGILVKHSDGRDFQIHRIPYSSGGMSASTFEGDQSWWPDFHAAWQEYLAHALDAARKGGGNG